MVSRALPELGFGLFGGGSSRRPGTAKLAHNPGDLPPHAFEKRRSQVPGAICWEDDGIGEGGALDQNAGGAVAARFRSSSQALLVADECHMVPAPKISELLDTLLEGKKGRRLVGLTATLLRESGAPGGKDVEGDVPWPLLGTCVFRETFANLAPEFLAPVRCLEVSVPVLGEWGKLFKKQPLAAAVCLSRGKWAVLEHLLAKHAGESMLITVERCEQARLLAAMFGIIPLDGSVPAAQMKDYLERFRQRKILALVATHVLDDSADFPELSESCLRLAWLHFHVVKLQLDVDVYLAHCCIAALPHVAHPT